MKKKLMLIIILIAIVGLAAGIKLNIFSNAADTMKIEAESDADLSFAVVSDIHANKDNFKNAIDDLYNINSKMDALVMNGDSVNQGLDEEYTDIKDVLKEKSKKLPDTIIKNIGNHEYYDYSGEVSNEEDVQELINKYLEFSGNDKIYHDSWIKGYHFISMGSDDTGVEKVNYTSASISDEQIQWLKDAIRENYEEGKPIFVFLHQPIDMKFFTIDGSGVDKNDEIKDILSNYPEVILFTSHTHITPDNSVDETKQLTTVNTGSVNSNYVTDESSERGFKEDTNCSNGLYVDVKGNEVIIKAINFKTNELIYERRIQGDFK